MFTDESGRLGNVPSVETLRKAMTKPDCCGQSMPIFGKSIVNSLMDQIGATVRGRLAEANLSQAENETRKFILKEFARTGKPPAAKTIVEVMKLPSIQAVRQLIEKFNKADILTVEGGEIISAYPFAAKQTRHKVIFPDGHEIYSLCATDALGIHFMLEEDISVRSRCPECEEEIKVEMKGGKIVSYEPTSIVEFVSSGDHCGCTSKTFCPFMNFFCSKDHVETWREKNPAAAQGEMYQLHQVLEHGKFIFGDFLK
jgi:hypothetical protein